MRHLVALPVVAALALSAAGCTSDQEAQSLAAINVACTLAGVGSQIAINVATGGKAATITGAIGADVTSSCGLLIPAVQSAVNQITGAGQTATVTVTTTTPTTGAVKSMRFHARKLVTGQMVYTFPPVSQIPFLSDLGL